MPVTMGGLPWILTSALLVFYLGFGATKVLSPGVVTMHQAPQDPIIPDAGDVINCGNTSTEALITFRPRHFSFGDTIDIRCHIVPPVYVDGGTVDVSIYVPGSPDPVFQKADIAFNCDHVHAYSPLKCPFEKGVPVDAEMKYYLAPDVPLPKGDLLIKVKFYQVPKPDKEFLCLFGHFSVIDG